MADAISIEETNRIRVSLGMKPLAVPGAAGPVFKEVPSAPAEDLGSTLESRQAEGYDNYRKLQEGEETKKKREAKAEAIKKARDTAKRFAKLEGKGLGEADDDGDLDAKAWLMKQKKRQKEIEKARKKEQERAEAEAAAAAEYTAKDLAGVRVGHELDTFVEGEDQVLTLKDTTIDENEEEGDELENLDLREREKLSDKLELKKKKPTYNPNDDDDESGDRKILAHYDEDIDGKKGNRFTLDGMGSTTETASADTAPHMKAKAKIFSLDILKDDEPKSDYLNISDIKVRKSKKKKAKSTRQRTTDEDDVFLEPEPAVSNGDVADAMDVDGVSRPVTVKKRTFEDTSFVDDDDLQALLATQRRNALKKRQKIRPGEFAQRLRKEASAIPAADDEEGNDSGLVIDETSEFVANLQKPVAPEPKQRSVSRPADAVTSMDADSDDDGDGDVQMSESYANIEDDEDRLSRIKREEANEDIENNGLEKEATLDNVGLGSMLNILRGRGILKTSESGDVATIFREKQMFLAEKQRREAEAERRAKSQRERDRTTGRLDRMSAREKEEHARQQNTMRDQQESRQLADHFNREYKPNVELKYIDEHGRNMNRKEAFKHLSHQFHGKGSGKQKTEKLLKKIEDEKRREAQSSLDGSQIGGMTGAAAQQLKKNRQAGVRLA
ncbi:putative U4/U6.U5 tri-snRNP-associated protein snu66 [Sclerotinia borealis F-4128]|uniref:Putative U4/U6.U5 tri-snRNP-associated protein snu66 n=1 Tax=Sclerotinia borealis (strain F-4128) TaxID=1432307 RepID=W9CSN4_SCLBF|nr:putative U4/U6.U5 tri-snRNP-associated protein snu66 [Sclerotinia borealis F-4128]